MGRHSGYASHDCRPDPVFALQQVHDVFGSGKSQSHTSGIDNAIQVLVVIGIVAQHEPQHEQLGHLLGQCGGKQRRGDRPPERAQVIHKQANHPQQLSDDQRNERGTHSIEE